MATGGLQNLATAQPEGWLALSLKDSVAKAFLVEGQLCLRTSNKGRSTQLTEQPSWLSSMQAMGRGPCLIPHPRRQEGLGQTCSRKDGPVSSVLPCPRV